MKKVFIAILLTIGINTYVFSQTETWLSFGFEYGNFWENSSDGSDNFKGYMGSPGIGLSAYNFWNKGNIGLFVHDIFAFPTKMTAEINGVKSEIDLSNYFSIQVGIIIGPGFRYHITDAFKLYYGIGLNYFFTSSSSDNSSVITYNLGIGGDIGLKYDISDVFYINIGSIIACDFMNFSIVSTSYSTVATFEKKYSLIHLRPYICIGFNFYRENDNMGKPK